MNSTTTKSDAVKACFKCGETKTLGEFGKRTAAKDGKSEWCKACTKESSAKYRNENPEKVRVANRNFKRKIRAEDPERYREKQNEWYDKNRERMQKRRGELRETKRFETLLADSRSRAKKYDYAPCNATPVEAEAAFTGRCEICGVPEAELNGRLHMDHCHESGNLRGFLCGNCNRALGYFKDSENIVIDALHYLMGNRRSEQQQ